MKRIIIAILAVLYLGTSTGMTLQLHYCMGELADWELGHNESKTCGNCGMENSYEKDNGCCKDESKFFKNLSDQKIIESSFQLMGSMGTAIVPVHAELPIVKLSSVTEENPVSNAPPKACSVAIYILNRTLLI